MRQEEGVLVQRGWAERVNNALFGNKTAKSSTHRTKSLFYDMRPAVLVGSWGRVRNNLFSAVARFVDDDGNVNTDRTIKVYKLTKSPDYYPDGRNGTLVDVVFRGRWEVVAGQEITAELSVSGNTLYIDIMVV